MIEGWPESVSLKNMVDIFGTFSFASSLKIDWDKFEAYWQSITCDTPIWLITANGSGKEMESSLNFWGLHLALLGCSRCA